MFFKVTDPVVAPHDTDLLLYHEDWIDEDSNPEGIRVGFFNGEGWASAEWCYHHGTYHTRLDAPTHFMLIPKSPRYEGENHGQSSTSNTHQRTDHHTRSGDREQHEVQDEPIAPLP